MKFIDTHCHIFREYYDNIPILMKEMENSDICCVINNGCDTSSNLEVLSLINNYSFMYGAIGIHPEYASTYTKDDIKTILDNISNEKIVAIGEIGLDYHYSSDNKDNQKELFELQLKIAEKNELPVIIHIRDAYDDALSLLKNHNVNGVIHCFSGSIKDAYDLVKRGFYLGVNGIVTFKNANIIDIIKTIGINHFVLETDSPYLAPVPYRGNQNYPLNVKVVASFIAEQLNISVNKVVEITNQNVYTIFDIPKPM